MPGKTCVLSCFLFKGSEILVLCFCAGFEEDGPDSHAAMEHAYKWILKWGGGLALVLIIVWPCLALPAKVFSKGYFTFWVILSIVWGLVSTAPVGPFLPASLCTCCAHSEDPTSNISRPPQPPMWVSVCHALCCTLGNAHPWAHRSCCCLCMLCLQDCQLCKDFSAVERAAG